ncbi:unnamed protein product, partial [Ilex paraguariensis]
IAKIRGVSALASKPRATRKEKGKATIREQDPKPLESQPRMRKKASYESIIEGKIYERMVDHRSLRKGVPIRRIVQLGLNFSFKNVEGYILTLCHQFYNGLREFDLDLKILRTMVRGQIIQVTSDIIAEYLAYERP